MAFKQFPRMKKIATTTLLALMLSLAMSCKTDKESVEEDELVEVLDCSS